MVDKNEFLDPRHSYKGKVHPENLVFNANLQEFSQRVSYTCALETNGKISSDRAYKNIKSLWKQLKKSKKQLGIGKHSVDESDE